MRKPIKISPMYHRQLELIRPGDYVVVMSIEEVLTRSFEAAAALPAFLDFNPENILLFILRNLASQTSAGHMEYIVRALLDQIHESFVMAAFPVDPLVISVAMSIITYMIDALTTTITQLGLFTAEGLFFYRPAIINKLEVVMYDIRLRPEYNANAANMGCV